MSPARLRATASRLAASTARVSSSIVSADDVGAAFGVEARAAAHGRQHYDNISAGFSEELYLARGGLRCCANMSRPDVVIINPSVTIVINSIGTNRRITILNRIKGRFTRRIDKVKKERAIIVDAIIALRT